MIVSYTRDYGGIRDDFHAYTLG